MNHKAENNNKLERKNRKHILKIYVKNIFKLDLICWFGYLQVRIFM